MSPRDRERLVHLDSGVGLSNRKVDFMFAQQRVLSGIWVE